MPSSSAFSLKVVIERQHCRRGQLLIAVLILLALWALLLSAGGARGALPDSLRLFAACMVVATGCREIRRASAADSTFAARIVVLPGGHLLVGQGAAAPVPVTLTASWLLPCHAAGLTYVTRNGVRGRALLFRGGVAPDCWRRLVVHLRFT